jgi:hypothetical protein
MTQQLSLSCLENMLKRPIIERQCKQVRLNCPPPHMAVKMGGGAAQAELLHAMMTQQVSLSCLENMLKRPIIERQCKQVRPNCPPPHIHTKEKVR